uniref:Uncharacterized protein n=1 Tax=Plectus sambesii TaxID=2011161 RepID=A0A914X2A1_9BILA
ADGVEAKSSVQGNPAVYTSSQRNSTAYHGYQNERLRSILNHLWFSVDNCSNDPVRWQELFRSIIHHIANEHSWKEDQSFLIVFECCHAQLSAEKVATTGWLSKQSDAYKRLFAILTDKRLLKNVGRIAKNLTTSAVENYHSVRLTYASRHKA